MIWTVTKSNQDRSVNFIRDAHEGGMRQHPGMRNRLFAGLLLLLQTIPAPGVAQEGVPDPTAGDPGHYWADPTRPVQTDLRDCHLFDVLAWGKGIDETRTRMRMACRHLSRFSGGSDPDRATAAALLAFEAEARAQMVRIDETVSAGSAGVRLGSLLFRTGWWADTYSQDRLIEAHALDLILEAAFDDQVGSDHEFR